MKRLRKIDYRHYICIAITLGFLACGVFVFPNALFRFLESVRDFGLSAAYYFCEMFRIDYSFTPTVNDLPSELPVIFLPETWEGFKENWGIYWKLWADKDNFLSYLSAVGNVLYYVAYLSLLVIPLILALWLLLGRILRQTNNDYDHDSRPLSAWKRFVQTVCCPVKLWISDFLSFLRKYGTYWKLWAFLWAFYFNAFSIATEFLAFYLYFVMSFDFTTVYRQIYKLFIDLTAVLSFVPLWAWVIIGFIVFDRIRKNIAYARLNHYERRNRGFINARSLVVMVVGTMGKGKTTMLTDMCLSTEIMFRDKAFEKILENDLKFPNFPWINLENALKRAISLHEIFNLAGCRAFVRHLQACFYTGSTDNAMRKCCRRHLKKRYGLNYDNLCFGYDYERNGFTYNNQLEVVDLWSVIETYAQLYFIYVMESSLLIANYSIRSDIILSDLGNFPLWNGEFFKRDSRLIDSYSRHAHILDFDTLRLGRTVVEENRQSNAFEFGVVAISEIGKERRNALELRETKKNTEETNQKNDGFNDGLKMRRHSATVDNYPFIKIISDEQRPESLGADARDMFDIVHIREREENTLAMPFFSLGELLYGWLFGKFTALYSNYRHLRGDNILSMHLLKGLTAKINHYYTGIYNRFGYNVLQVQIENGTLDGQYSENKYFLSWKKIYSRRFATDCMSAFWEERALRSPIGLNDMREYEFSRATWEELKGQNSYFVRDLIMKY